MLNGSKLKRSFSRVQRELECFRLSKNPIELTFLKEAHWALSDTTIWQITEPALIQKIDERWYFGSTMFWRWRPLRRDGRIDPFTLTAAYVALFSLFLSLSSSLFLLLFPCLDNLLPRTPYTYSLDLRLFPCSFLTVIGSLLSRPFYSFASSLFGRLFFNLRRNAFHGTLEESEVDFRKMKRTGGFWEMFDPDKPSLIVSCTFLRFVFDGTIVSRRWSHIGLR